MVLTPAGRVTEHVTYSEYSRRSELPEDHFGTEYALSKQLAVDLLVLFSHLMHHLQISAFRETFSCFESESPNAKPRRPITHEVPGMIQRAICRFYGTGSSSMKFLFCDTFGKRILTSGILSSWRPTWIRLGFTILTSSVIIRHSTYVTVVLVYCFTGSNRYLYIIAISIAEQLWLA